MVGPDTSSPFAQRGESERKLLDHVQRLEGKGDGLVLLYVHLSRLRSFNRRSSLLRAIASSFDLFIKAKLGDLFELSNKDLAFICKEQTLDAVKSALAKHYHKIADDPLLANNQGADDGLLVCYDMDRQFQEIVDLLQQAVQSRYNTSQIERLKSQVAGGSMGGSELAAPLTPIMLGQIETALAQADLVNDLRRQYACVLSADKPPELVFSAFFISMSDLQETLDLDVDLTLNRWLFHHMMAILDRRVLSMVTTFDPKYFSNDISINLRVETLLSDVFIEFDRSNITARRGALLVGVQVPDLLRDLEAFLFAHEFLRAREYRLCLNGLTLPLLALLDLDRIGADAVKLLWSEEFAGAYHKNGLAVKDLIEKAGADRVVLCQCDTRQAIEVGQDLGISIFQGRYVEDLIDAERLHNRMTASRRLR